MSFKKNTIDNIDNIIFEKKNKKKIIKSIHNYKKLCAFDRKCFIHKDKTNKIFRDMLKNNTDKNINNILCLDSSQTKTSNMLISENLSTIENIILIEGNKSNYKKHISNGFNSIYGNCLDVIKQYYFDKFDGIYLDAIGSVDTVSELVFESIKNNLINDRCVIGYTFVKRGRIKGVNFETSYKQFMKNFIELLNINGFKIIDSESYKYGSPRTGQANMFTEFVCVEKINE